MISPEVRYAIRIDWLCAGSAAMCPQFSDVGRIRVPAIAKRAFVVQESESDRHEV